MQASSGPSGEALLAIAALAAIQLTAGKSDAQAAVLGAFFTMLCLLYTSPSPRDTR